VNGFPPRPPLRRPQNGALRARPEPRTRVRKTGSGRRYPVLGPPSSPFGGGTNQVNNVNH